jgi:hypothetical protein
MEYLVILAYESDTEREKDRLAIERWKDKTEIIKTQKGQRSFSRGAILIHFLMIYIQESKLRQIL